MDDYDKYYIALGLRRGATQEDIRSAYRRMAKLYHPDHDASLDAEVRYHDARKAYDVLRKRSDTQPLKSPPPNSAKPRETTYYGAWTAHTTSGAGWYAHESDDDLLWEQHVKDRIPFSFEKIPVILWESIIETVSVEKLIRVLLYVVMMNSLLGRLGYGKFFSNVVAFCSLTGFTFFRYYYSYDPANLGSNLFTNLIWSLKYIAVVGFAFLMFSPGRGFSSIKNWLVMPFEIFIALFLLWAPPIIRTGGQKRQRHGW